MRITASILILLFFSFKGECNNFIPTDNNPAVTDFRITTNVEEATESKTPADTTDHFKRDKIIAAVLAFPVPFGFTGLHRIYLGSEPWVPVVYLCTGGGGVGIIPLIDFICILSADKETFETYTDNPKFFMWIE